ncbi:MAG: FtsX-like permease family protein [Rikenellaceae bacterium]
MLRNFISTIRCYTTSSLLNILGLSVAFTAFYIIISQVAFELKFDKFHSASDRIYKAEILFGDGRGQTVVSRAFVNTLTAASPLIEKSVLIGPSWGKSYFVVEQNGNKVGFSEDIEMVYPSIADVFDFKMVEGSMKALEEPEKVVIPLSIANKLFGNKPSLGKTLTTQSGRIREVGGVYQDFPDNSQLNNHILTKIYDHEGRTKDGADNWNQNNYFMYVKLAKGASPRVVENQYAKSINLGEKMFGEDSGAKAHLTLMSDLYFAKRDYAIEHLIKHGDINATIVMSSIALLILIIAAINFINFSTSLAPIRMKSINIQKVLGSTNLKLRLKLISEAVFLCLLSFGVSLLIIYGLSQSQFQNVTMNKIMLSASGPSLVFTAVITIALGVVAGIYPAFYATNFSPAIALKGSAMRSRSGHFLRSFLMGFQFVASTILIIAAIFLQIQNNYLKKMDTGLPKENIIIAELGGGLKSKSFETELKANPAIKDVAYAQYNIGGCNLAQGWGSNLKGKSIMYDAHFVSWNFPKMMGLQIVDGEMFTEEDLEKEDGTFIFNQTAVKQFDIKIGDNIKGNVGDGSLVKGVVKDFNFKSLHYEITPMALVLSPNSSKYNFMSVAYIKIEGDPYEAVDYVKKVAKNIDPAYPLVTNFYDQTFNNLYEREQKSTRLITLFSLLAIIISLVGVFGLVVFETHHRRKEIGMRKISGATVGSILMMLNRRFVILILICFAIAVVPAWIGVNMWLKEFAYRTPIDMWVFVVALLMITFITMTTVTIQSWRAATENPTKSLKSE